MLFLGNIDNPNSYGTNELIKEGARLVTNPIEIVEGLLSRKNWI